MDGNAGKRLALDARHLGPGGRLDEDALLQITQRQPIRDSGLEELDIDISMAVGSSLLLEQLSGWLGEEAVAARHTLRSLRLSGALHLATIFGRMAPFAAEFCLLESVYLARGGDNWQPEAAACTLPQLPALRLLEFRFSFDEEEPPQNLPSLLLLPQPGPGLPLLPPLQQQPPSLHHLRQQLQHLVLVFPIRSVIPPTEQLPDEMSTLVQLTSLKVKRVPMVATPTWLGALTQLQNLLWDPALPADCDYVMPPGLEKLTRLEGLWIITQMPLHLPTSLGQSLQGLHVIGKGFREEHRDQQRWDWLQHYTQLRGIRMQGVGLAELPPEIVCMQHLTRLDLMCNQLEELPPGPYLQQLRCIHLGNNRLSLFPSTLLSAKLLEDAYLANQSASSDSGRSSPGGSMSSGCSSGVRCGAGYTRRMELSEADVDGLVHLTCLRTLIMCNLQPVVHLRPRHGLEARQHDFTWLQRVLRRKGARLTSNELAYQLECKGVFHLPPLLPGGLRVEDSLDLMDSVGSAGDAPMAATAASWGTECSSLSGGTASPTAQQAAQQQQQAQAQQQAQQLAQQQQQVAQQQ